MNRTRSILGTASETAVKSRITVADRIVDLLAERTDHVFGVGGANIEDLYDALQRSAAPITGIVAKHEFGAATMADGYARTTNRLGVVAATSGGGALNLVAALGESFDSRVPVLALIGQPPRALEGRGAFQDTSGGVGRIDAERLFGSVSRFCVKVTRAEDVTAALAEAMRVAMDGGPAVLLLPKDIQAHALPDPVVLDGRRLDVGLARGDVEAYDQPEAYDEALALVRSAASSGLTVIIAGPEVARADVRAELIVMARALRAVVTVTPDAKDAFPNDHPLFAGIAGSMGHPRVAELIGDAALCVLVGTPMPVLARAGLEAALANCPRVLHMGTDPAFVQTHARLRGPLGSRLREVASAVPSDSEFEPARLNLPPALKVPPSSGPGVRYRDAVEAINARLTPGTDVVVDAGNTGAAAVHHLPVPADSRFVIALGMGGMGYAFGAGIGSALGRRRRTFVIAGDGAYFMHGHEVHTAVEHHVPVTFVIFNNNAHAMCVTREQLYYSGDYTYNRFGPARIGAAVAAMFPHIPAYSTDTRASFEAALDETRSATGPVFIEILCDPDEIPPFAPFLKELSA
ncbi:thiamine pyrophosphate-binding protein [Nocardia colli]|uniref:acetolactate synthase n=1 Tax=Nocardia colli TaxID=2545717 RepID=A0A5N0E258_9NOCA|nr:thiamine pyrophosphate-binding protein [Nocardia colli]KAA8883056.1 thiamine pyrophosphate-binding protein [Nocardia colli]